MSIWRGRTGYRAGRGTVAVWLLTAVRYRALDVVRRSTRHSSRRAGEDGLDDLAAGADMPEEILIRDEARRIRALLAQLPAVQREIITLAFYGQLTHVEIAAVLDLPAGTVKGRMRLGLYKLRAGIEQEVA